MSHGGGEKHSDPIKPPDALKDLSPEVQDQLDKDLRQAREIEQRAPMRIAAVVPCEALLAGMRLPPDSFITGVEFIPPPETSPLLHGSVKFIIYSPSIRFDPDSSKAWVGEPK